MASELARELRENGGYLEDAGWGSTAALMQRAASELDELHDRLQVLEARQLSWRHGISARVDRWRRHTFRHNA